MHVVRAVWQLEGDRGVEDGHITVAAVACPSVLAVLPLKGH